MNTLRKIRKNTKALSPVVASIILIAVTVAVSIAVAAWMGALTIGFMDTEQLKITSVKFTDDGIVVSVSNTGTNGVTISGAWVNDVDVIADATFGTSSTILANGAETITIDYEWALGSNYQVRVMTAKGNQFMYNAIA